MAMLKSYWHRVVEAIAEHLFLLPSTTCTLVPLPLDHQLCITRTPHHQPALGFNIFCHAFSATGILPCLSSESLHSQLCPFLSSTFNTKKIQAFTILSLEPLKEHERCNGWIRKSLAMKTEWTTTTCPKQSHALV